MEQEEKNNNPSQQRIPVFYRRPFFIGNRAERKCDVTIDVTTGRCYFICRDVTTNITTCAEYLLKAVPDREESHMQISSRFTIALHIFACVDTFEDQYKVTSDFLASSINTNPVIVRKILSQLKNAGLITVARGTGGIALTRPKTDISFFDVYEAIEPVEKGDLFHFHEGPNPDCPVGRNIHALLDGKLRAIQSAMEAEMKKYTMADIHAGMQELLEKES